MVQRRALLRTAVRAIFLLTVTSASCINDQIFAEPSTGGRSEGRVKKVGMGSVSTKKIHVMVWQRGGGLVVLCGLATLLACARVPVSGIASTQPERPARSDHEVLRERAQAYWQARMIDDMAKAYTFENSLMRSQVPLMYYIRTIGTGIKLTGVEVNDARIDGDQADVFVGMEGHHMIPGWHSTQTKRTLIDDWQKIDGEWFHVIDFHLIRAGKPRVNADGTMSYQEEPSRGVPPQSKQ